jgi:hypothetical protein
MLKAGQEPTVAPRPRRDEELEQLGETGGWDILIKIESAPIEEGRRQNH